MKNNDQVNRDAENSVPTSETATTAAPVQRLVRQFLTDLKRRIPQETLKQSTLSVYIDHAITSPAWYGTLKHDGKCIATNAIVAEEDVDRNEFIETAHELFNTEYK